MLRDAFAAISRDGAALYEVQIALQRALLGLVNLEPRVFGRGAVIQSERAMSFSTGAMLIDSDIAQLRVVAQQLAHNASLGVQNSRASQT